MAWWNDNAYTCGLTASELETENLASFPDYTDWQSVPATPLLCRMGARNLLAGYMLGSLPADFLNQAEWATDSPPLPGFDSWSRDDWHWLLRHTVCIPVFIPVLDGDQGRLLRFDCVMGRRGLRFPAHFEESQSALRHAASYRAARSALRRLEPGLKSEYRFYADDDGCSSRGKSASLGLALAAWTGALHQLNDQSPALENLHRAYAVTGALTAADGHIEPVSGLKTKAAACFRRLLLTPYAGRRATANVLTVNTWEDAKARLAPSFTGSDRGSFPACDVLFQFVSKQTEPLLNFAAHLRPRQAVVLLTSDNYEYSLEPAARVAQCLLENRAAWHGEKVAVIRRRIESRRLHLAEQDLHVLFEEYARSGTPEERIVLNLTGGNKLMTMAACNVARGRACPLMYLEFHEREYSIIGWTRDGRPRPTRFIRETNDPLASFDQQSVAVCKGIQALRK